jgi:cyclopropane fatty-acyl-phospholipid synthase-like methyltransferase
VLRAIAQLLRPGGRLAFATIFVPADLAPADQRRAIQAGPRAVAARGEHSAMLKRAGFVDIDETDITADFLRTAHAWLEHAERLADELRASIGAALFDERQNERRDFIAAIRDGLLRRSVFYARRPA